MIKELIYSHFDLQRQNKEKREINIDKINFAPSYIDKCKRQIFYQKRNEPQSNPIEIHSYIKFAMGDSVHLSLQNILKEIGIYKEGEEFKEAEMFGLNWLYRIDGLLELNNNKFIIEIKSVYSSGYNSIEHEAKREHELQLLMYMLFEKIEFGIILYIGRDNGFIVEYNYHIEALKEKHKDFILNKAKELKLLQNQIENNFLPNRDYNVVIKNMSAGKIQSDIIDGVNHHNLSFEFQKDSIKYKSDWQCLYCSWKNTCWSKELEEIKNNDFFINNKFIKEIK